MKKLFFLLLVIPVMAFSQASTSPNIAPGARVIEQSSFNKTKAITGATTDTTAKTTAKFLVDIAVTFPIAADSIRVYETTNTGSLDDAYILVPATASNPFVIPINKVVDSTYVVVSIKKTSKVFLHYRTTPY